MSLILDDSTTALRMVPLLEGLTPLTVATNFLEAMRPLSRIDGVRLMAFGGDYDPQHDSFCGLSCIHDVQAVRVEAVFVSTSAIAGPMAYHQQQHVVAVKRAMLEVATRRYLLIDHAKIRRTALHRLSALSVFDRVIVDAHTSAEAVAELQHHDVGVDIAGPHPASTC